MDRETRSRLMSRIRAKDTVPELMLRRALHRHGVRFRIHGMGIPGRPDIFWKGRRIVVFIHGCFWHACPEHFVRPASNRRFWDEKIQANIERDKRVRNQLTEMGWTVIELWEHEVVADTERCVEVIQAAIETPI